MEKRYYIEDDYHQYYGTDTFEDAKHRLLTDDALSKRIREKAKQPYIHWCAIIERPFYDSKVDGHYYGKPTAITKVDIQCGRFTIGETFRLD